MIAGIPIEILGYGSGWAILSLLVIMIFRGDLRTTREAKAQDRHIETLAKSIETKDQTISEFRETIATSNALIQAVLDVAQERQSGGVP